MSEMDGLALFRDSLAHNEPDPGPALTAEQLAAARATFPQGYSDMLAD
jgi:hypothetical protein